MRWIWSWLHRHPVKAGALGGWFQQFASGIVTLTIIPLINHRLSPSEAGLWFSFQGLSMVTVLTDFGVGFAVSRQVAYSMAATEKREESGDFIATRPGWDGISDLYAAMKVIFHRIVFVALAILIALHEIVLPYTKLGADRTVSSTLTWYLFGCSTLILIFLKRYQSLLDGIGRMHVCRFLAGSYQFVSGLAAIVGLLLSRNLAVMALCVVATTLLYAIVLRAFLLRESQDRLETQSRPPPGLVGRLWKVATPMGIVGVGGYFVSAVQVPLIGSLLGPTLVTPYYAAQKIGQMLNIAVAQMSGPQMPLFTASLGAQRWAEARHRLRRTVILVMGATSVVNLGFFFLSPYAADLWLGAGHYPDRTTLAILSIDYVVSGVAVALGQFVLASGANPFMWTTLAMGFLNLFCCIVFARAFALPGIAASGLVAGLLTNYWALPLHGFRLVRKLSRNDPLSV